MDEKYQFILTLLFVIFLRYIFVSRRKRAKKQEIKGAPQVDGALPIIGHLHRFGGGKLTHKVLGAMADEYRGPAKALAIRLGSHQALVVSSLEMAKECFTTHDINFSDRPRILASKILGYDYAMFGFAPYGTYWREMRKNVTIELMSSKRIEMLKPIRTTELETSIRDLFRFWASSGNGSPECGVLVDMKPRFVNLARSLAMRMVGGKRSLGDEESQKTEKVIREFVHLFDTFVLSDTVPFLGWFVDLVQGHSKSMKRVARELDNLVHGWLEEHKQKRINNDTSDNGRDLMDAMIEILTDAQVSADFDSDTIIKSACLNILLAGSDAVGITLTWALSLLLNNREMLDKAQEELDTQVGRDRKVEEFDIKNLIFLQAVVKETLRLYPPSPLIGLRSAIEDCTFSQGIHVPAGTRLMVNVWKIQRDEVMWPDPHEFKPDRFLTTHKEVDARGQHFEYMPGGAGRRSCPGMLLGLHTIHICLATFLQCFNFYIPPGEKIDITESPGLTNLKPTPLEARITPRLPTALYEH